MPIADLLAPALLAVVLATVAFSWMQRATYIASGWLQHGSAPRLVGVSTLQFLKAWWQHPLHPETALHGSARLNAPSPALYAGLDLFALAALFGLAAAVVGSLFRRAAEGDQRGPGSGWASRREISELVTRRRDEPGRIALGRVGRRQLATRPEQSLLVFGPTRSGKTSRIAIPAITAWRGPAIVVSTKTDLVLATIEARRSLGQVAVFDPTNASGLPTAGWDPVDSCDDPTEARRMADRFVRLAGTTDGMGGSFWTATAGQLLAPLLHAAAILDATMAQVSAWVRTADLAAPGQILAEAGANEMAEAVDAVRGQDSRLRDSTLATLRTVLAAYDDSQLAAKHDITAEWLLSSHNTLYVVGSSDDQRRLAPVFLALLGSIVDAAYRRTEALRREAVSPVARLDPPMLLLLDEAANMAPIPDMATLASTAGGMGVQLLSVYQDRSQLRRIYGHDAADSICNAHAMKLALSGLSDPDTLTYISRLAGSDIRPGREDISGNRLTLPESEVARTRRGRAILLPAGGRPMRLMLGKAL